MKKIYCAAFVVAAALAAPTAAGASEVVHWNEIATTTLAKFPGPAGGAAQALPLNLAMTQGAVYDALNAIEAKHYRPYLLMRRFGATASEDAAAATAAYRVLSSLVAGVPAAITFANRTVLQQELDAQYAASLAAVPDGPFKDQGIAAGNAAAEAMIAARQDDGRFAPFTFPTATGPGYWQPFFEATPVFDPAPWVGGVRPFLLESGAQFRTAGPNALTSAQWAADFNEVKALGRAVGSIRTADQTHIAIFWQSNGGPAVLWNRVARSLVGDPEHQLGIARLFAMLNLSGADAAINCWNDKYYWDFWRPWTAIRQADTDGNPATAADPTWAPLIAAPYPEHPSGHLCLDGAQLHVLQMFFGTGMVHFGVTSSQFGGETRYFDSFADALAEITDARIWAGLHFRTADVQAKLLGQNIADYMTDHYFAQVGAPH